MGFDFIKTVVLQSRNWRRRGISICNGHIEDETSAAISGNSVYGKLKFESGVHRLQRVPVTEKSGRIHTSAIPVAILPQANENTAKALKVLCARPYEIERTRINLDRSKLRAEQIGSGDRSERVCTYNFPHGQVTDRHVGITPRAIDDMLQGESLDVFIDALLLRQEMDAIASFSSINT